MDAVTKMTMPTLDQVIEAESTRYPGSSITVVYDMVSPTTTVTMYGQDATSTFRLIDGRYREVERLPLDI